MEHAPDPDGDEQEADCEGHTHDSRQAEQRGQGSTLASLIDLLVHSGMRDRHSVGLKQMPTSEILV